MKRRVKERTELWHLFLLSSICYRGALYRSGELQLPARFCAGCIGHPSFLSLLKLPFTASHGLYLALYNEDNFAVPISRKGSRSVGR